MKTTLILSSIFTHFNSRNKYTNKQKKLYHKTRLFTHFFLPHSTGNLGYHNFFISFIHIYLCSHILFFLEFSPIQQIKQAHVFLFLGVNMKKIRLAQCTSLRQLAIVLFQRRWLYRLLYQFINLLFSSFSVSSPHTWQDFCWFSWFIYIFDRELNSSAELTAQCYARLLSNAMCVCDGGAMIYKNTQSGRFGAL